MHRNRGFSLCKSGLLVLILCGDSEAQTFDSSAVDRLRITTGTYELDLSKTNGAILDLRDPVAGLSLTLGSRGGCLWGTNYQSQANSYKGGCFFSPDGADAFTYKWDATQKVLVLSYVSAANSPQRVDATVTITFAADHFDMAIVVTNHTGTTLSAVLFPSDLLLGNSSIQAAYILYFLPGVRLRKEYFATPRSFGFVYPGAASFANFRALDIGSSHVAWYVVNPSGRIAPVAWGLQNDAQTKPGTSYFYHNFQAWTADGGTFQTPLVRFRVGQSADDVALRYKEENGISAYASSSEKLGTFFAAVAAAPLVKLDLGFVAFGSRANPSFARLGSRLSLIRSPALLHPVTYWPVGFDRNYPDFLPPDPRYGTTPDFAAFARSAQSSGMLTMPYTNPTWWDPRSPTVKGASVAAFSALDQAGNSIVETYGPNTGFVASPDSPATQKRLDDLMKQWTQDVPVDFVLNDQIGSRAWIKDFNPGAPDALHYSEAWLAFTRAHKGQRLMTEDGWDRLAETEVGFTGSALTARV